MHKTIYKGNGTLQIPRAGWRRRENVMKNTASKMLALLVSAAVLVPCNAYADRLTVNKTDIQDTGITLAVSNNVQFTDIDGEAYEWAAPFIESMTRRGYISGYEEDGVWTFRPDNEVTRLEGLSLFSRAMGCTEENNEELLELAHEQYDAMLKNYALPWGDDEISYLLYKGALTKSDLDTYLLGNEKNRPMQRYEAAIIITKALGGAYEAERNEDVSLSYFDSELIPAFAAAYVQYASDNGILRGLDDGTFAPDMAVSRSQMAVMQSRTVEKTNYKFKPVTITSVDEEEGTITLEDEDGKSDTYDIEDGLEVRRIGEPITVPDIPDNIQAIVTLSNNRLKAIDITSSTPNEKITGTYKGMSTSNGIITLNVVPTGEKSSKRYTCSSKVSIYFDGTPATMRSFTEGAYVTLETKNGRVVSVRGQSKAQTLKNATIKSMNTEGTFTITIAHGDKEYDGKTYEIDDNVTVTKNGVNSDLRSIYSGDTATLTIEYGKIKKIAATSKNAVIEGTIQAFTISSNPTITVKVGSEEKVFSIAQGVEIKVNGEDGKLCDFSVGDAVKVTTESNAVTKISAASVQENVGTASGIVTGINASYKVITIKTNEGNVMQFQCPDNGKVTTTFISLDTGTAKKLTNVKTDQSVEVKYSVSNGVYIAKLVLLLN